MRNIHVIPTDKPSRLACDFDKLILNSRLLSPILYKTKNIYITNDEDIKEGDYAYYVAGFMVQKVYLGVNVSTLKAHKKIILTTDPQLIQDGVQAIPDEFLEWFVNNPSCEEIEVENIPNNSWGFDLEEPMNLGYKIIIPKEEPKQETLKEAAKNYLNSGVIPNDYQSFINSAKWQQEQDKNKYSEEEVIELLNKREDCINQTSSIFEYTTAKDWFEQFKKK